MPELPNISATMDEFGRLYYKAEELNHSGGNTVEDLADDGRVPCTKEKANLVSSETLFGTHMPVIDLDLPCRLVPSSTEGHFHLYIDHPVDEDKYLKLIQALADCGLVSEFYNQLSQLRGATFARPEWVKKEPKPTQGEGSISAFLES